MQRIDDEARRRCGWPVPLRGTGMALRAEVLAGLAPRLHTPAEDLELDLLLPPRPARAPPRPALPPAPAPPARPLSDHSPPPPPLAARGAVFSFFPQAVIYDPK